jgi:hypothetical protein
MEHIYNFNGKYVTLNDIKDDIIKDWVTTNKQKKEIHKIYPVSTTTLAKVLKGIKKQYCECVKCGEKDPQKFRETNKIQCKSCYSKSNSNYYENLPEEKKKEKINNQKKWQNNNIIKVRILGAKHRAKRKNIEFNIDEDYINELLIKQNYRCTYTNTELELKMGSDDMFINPNTISIDRINPKLGYTKNNVALVTGIVNHMKNELSETSFLEVINLIQKNYKKNF